MYRADADGRLNWHFLATDWNLVRLRLLGQAASYTSRGGDERVPQRAGVTVVAMPAQRARLATHHGT